MTLAIESTAPVSRSKFDCEKGHNSTFNLTPLFPSLHSSLPTLRGVRVPSTCEVRERASAVVECSRVKYHKMGRRAPAREVDNARPRKHFPRKRKAPTVVEGFKMGRSRARRRVNVWPNKTMSLSDVKDTTHVISLWMDSLTISHSRFVTGQSRGIFLLGSYYSCVLVFLYPTSLRVQSLSRREKRHTAAC